MAESGRTSNSNLKCTVLNRLNRRREADHHSRWTTIRCRTKRHWRSSHLKHSCSVSSHRTSKAVSWTSCWTMTSSFSMTRVIARMSLRSKSSTNLKTSKTVISIIWAVASRWCSSSQWWIKIMASPNKKLSVAWIRCANLTSSKTVITTVSESREWSRMILWRCYRVRSTTWPSFKIVSSSLTRSQRAVRLTTRGTLVPSQPEEVCVLNPLYNPWPPKVQRQPVVE